jgi:RHS repeat-associated protein
MRDKGILKILPILFVLLIVTLLPCWSIAYPYSELELGEVHGNGLGNIEDVRLDAQSVDAWIEALCPFDNRDATEDTQAIEQKAKGSSRIVVAVNEYGLPGKTYTGSLMRINVVDDEVPASTKGTVRIKSPSTGYDSGEVPLSLCQDISGHYYWYYHWDTSGLPAIKDYEVYVRLIETEFLSQPDLVVALCHPYFEIPLLAQAQDAFIPAPGINLDFNRVFPHDSLRGPYLGPFGFGWVHNFDIHLAVCSDGYIAGHDGFNRGFKSNSDGCYTASPGNFGTLTRDPDGTFTLREKDGFIYRFRSDLTEEVGGAAWALLDYMQDPNGNRVTAIYNEDNQLIEIAHSNGQSFYLTYNTHGRISKLIDTVGRETSYTYDDSGTHLISVTDPAGRVTLYTYYLGKAVTIDHRLRSITFPDETHVYYTYDSEGRITTIKGDAAGDRIKYSYKADGITQIRDAEGGTTTISVNERGQITQMKNPMGAETQFEYDMNSNPISITDPLNHIYHFDYDERGNVVQITDPLGNQVNLGYEPTFNKLTWLQDSLGRITTFSYDSQGNLLAISYPDGSTERFIYDMDNRLEGKTDANGKTTRYSYNNQGQLTALHNALGHVTQFSYDAAGDLQNATDAKGQPISYLRDTSGQLIRRTYPDGSHEDYEYDAAGKLTEFTNREGETISFSYDFSGRLRCKKYAPLRKTYFRYDSDRYLKRVSEWDDGTLTKRYYERDAAHRITNVKVTKVKLDEEDQYYTMSYTHDVADNRAQMIYPDGYRLNYAYDAANRLKRISDANDTTIVVYEYDAAGRRTRRVTGNGAYTTYDYDDMDRLTLLVSYAPNGTIQSKFAYTYNAAGIRTSMTTLEGVHDYTYDDIYQLTGVMYPDGRTVTYTFDEVGNRISVEDNGVVTNYTTNELAQYVQVGSESFEYDANGNLITRTNGGNVTRYGWDEDNRLVSVDRGDVHIDYRYDYQGRLVAKTIDGKETRYIWDDFDLIAEMDSDGQVVKRFVYGASLIDIALVTVDNTNYWSQQDGLGSIVGTTNDNGVTIATSCYDVYGYVHDGDLSPIPHHFAGLWWDKDAELYYARARWYSPVLGRFMQADPIGIAGGINLYTYANNNPVSYSDPYGLINDIRFFNYIFSGPLGGTLTLDFPREYVREAAGGFLWAAEQAATYGGILAMCPITIGVGTSMMELAIVLGILGAGLHLYVYLAELFGYESCLIDIPYPPILLRFLPRLLEWLNTNPGICPTFIQLPPEIETIGNSKSELGVISKELSCKITIPLSRCLLRSDIPIFGVAGGRNFQSYRVEFGKGTNPEKWTIIEQSNMPQNTCDVGQTEIAAMTGDIDIRGNLATWNTGLKNWVHLPWHPPEDPTDINGIYTIRLVVKGAEGKTVEDRVTCEVGRVIAQCLPGIAISSDKSVVMRFPEHSLTEPFRIYTILPLSDVDDEIPPAPAGVELIGRIYRVREPGDRFMKDVSLEFNVSKEALQIRDLGQFGIVRYDVEKRDWLWLDTAHSLGADATLFSTTLTELPKPKAIYALGYDANNSRSQPETEDKRVESFTPIAPNVLVYDTFEEEIGYWKSRDNFIGAVLTRDNTITPDGSYALKITNPLYGGSFGVTVLNGSFDVREYPTMSFDYRICPGVKTDFYLLVNGRWYNVGFTDDPIDFHNRDVNIANLGQIEGIVADDQWHSASVNIYELLRQKTRNTQVDAIVMADWDVTGYMKLDFGRNDAGATYSIDNFKIAAGPVYSSNEVLIVDTFETTAPINLLGEESGVFSNEGTYYCLATIIKDTTKTENHNCVLNLTFDASQSDAYCGYWRSLGGADLSDIKEISLQIYAPESVPPMLVGLRYKPGIESKVLIQPYLSSADAEGWQTATIPLSAFVDLPDLSSMDALFVTFENKLSSGSGFIFVDNIEFHQHQSTETNASINLLSEESGTFSNEGIGYCHATTVNVTKTKKHNHILNLSYDTSQKDAYCGYWTSLGGADLRDMRELSLRLYAPESVPPMLVGLRYKPEIEAKVPIQPYLSSADTEGWKTATIPLSAFVDLPDLSSMDAVFVTFENKLSSGSGFIFVDDIEFHKHQYYGEVVNFGIHGMERNLLGGEFRTVENEGANISSSYHEDKMSLQGNLMPSAKIAYGGTIGKDFGGRRFSYAIWETDLRGFDARRFENLALEIWGEKGAESPNIWLDDGTTRRCLRSKDFAPITASWQEIHIPLEKFASQGADLSHLEAIQLVFEWEEMNGTIYIAKIYFEGNASVSAGESEEFQQFPTHYTTPSSAEQPYTGFPTGGSTFLFMIIGLIGLGLLVLYTVRRRRSRNSNR